MRKDVECTFGILKGCWRVLKSGIRVHGHESTDLVWKTCCALHNWLLNIDGLDEEWTQGVLSLWEGELGQYDMDDIEFKPEHIRERLSSIEALCHYDSSNTLLHDGGDDDDCDNANPVVNTGTPTIEEPLPPPSAGQVCIVRKLTNEQFRSRLVEHFNILYQKNEIKCPRRLGKRQPIIPC